MAAYRAPRSQPVMLARRMAVTSVAQVLQLLLNSLTLILLARLLVPEDFGLFLLLTSAIALIAVAFTAGPQASLLVTGAKSPNLGARLHGQALTLSMASGVAAALFGALLASPAAAALSSTLPPMLVVLTLWRLTPTVYGGLVNAALMGTGRISEMAFLNVGSAATSLAAPVGALLLPSEPLAGSVVGALGGSMAFGVLALFVGWQSFGISVPTNWDLWRDMGRLALPVHVGTVAYWVMLRADLYVVNALVAGSAVGVYGFALSISERVSAIAAPIYGAAASQVSGVEREVATSTTMTLVRIHLWIAGLLFIVAIVGGGWLLEVLGGADYRDGAAPFALLLLGSAVLPIWSILGLFIISQLRAAWMTAALQIGAALLALILYWTLIPPLGITGAALGSTLAYVALPLMGAIFVMRHAAVPVSDLLPRISDLKAVWGFVRDYASGG